MDDQENVVPEMSDERRMQIQHSNMQIVNCSTPANYFHVLRRQVHRNFRKPLIVVTPKSLLRHKSAVSTLAELAGHTAFQRVLPDTSAAAAAPKKVRKLIFCTGKVYYDLEKHRADTGAHDVAIARVEQIAPFPFDLVAAEIKKFPAASVTWVQEEPRNMGAWSYVWPRFMTATRVLLGKEIMPVRAPACCAAASRRCLPSLTLPLPPHHCRCTWAAWRRRRRRRGRPRFTRRRCPRSCMTPLLKRPVVAGGSAARAQPPPTRTPRRVLIAFRPLAARPAATQRGEGRAGPYLDRTTSQHVHAIRRLDTVYLFQLAAPTLCVDAELVAALGALIKHGLALVRRPQLHGVELHGGVLALGALLRHHRARRLLSRRLLPCRCLLLRRAVRGAVLHQPLWHRPAV